MALRRPARATIVGIARYDRQPRGAEAEVAFFTDDSHAGRGLATVLLEYLAAAARRGRASRVHRPVLPDEPADARRVHARPGSRSPAASPTA